MKHIHDLFKFFAFPRYSFTDGNTGGDGGQASGGTAPATAGNGQGTAGADASQVSAVSGAASATAGAAAVAGPIIGSDGKFSPDFAKSHPKLAAKFTEPSALLKSYQNLEGMLSNQNKVAILNPSSTPEEIALYREKMGVPNDAKGYGLKLPAKIGDKEVPTSLMPQESIDKWAERFHKANIPKATAEALLSEYVQEALTGMDGINTAVQAEKDKAVAALKSEWGPKFDQQVQLANKAAKVLGMSDAEIADPAISNHPAFLRVLARAGAMMGEDTAAGARGSQQVIADPQARINEIRATMMTKGYNKNGPQHAGLLAEMQSLIGKKEQIAGRG